MTAHKLMTQIKQCGANKFGSIYEIIKKFGQRQQEKNA